MLEILRSKISGEVAEWLSRLRRDPAYDRSILNGGGKSALGRGG